MDPFEFADLFVGGMRSESETGSNLEVQALGIPQKVSGTVETDSAGGYAMVSLGGSSITEDDGQAIEMPTDISLKAGDEVAVEIVDGKPRVVGRIGWGDELQSVADEALEVAQATGQHFWHDDSGAHVSTEALNPTGASNSLWNSLGLLIRKAANNLVSITQSAIAFYDGNGNNSSNITAQFGSSGATIGKTSTSHMVQTSTGSTWYAPDGSTELAGIGVHNADVPMLWVGDDERHILASVENEGEQDQVDLLDISNYARVNSHHAGIYLVVDGSGGYANIRLNDSDVSGAVLDVCPSSINVGSGVEFRIGNQTLIESNDSLHAYGAITAASFNGFRGRKSLTTTDDIDALFETGVYYIQGNGAGGTFPTGTTGAYNSLISVGGHPSTESADSWVGKQILISGSTLYVRSYAGSPRAWSAWGEHKPYSAPTQTSTASSIFTPASGVTVTGAYYTTNGIMAQVYLTLSRSSAIAANTEVTLGTVVDGKRPKQQVNGGFGTAGSQYGNVRLLAGGDVRIRATAQIAASTSFTIIFPAYMLP